MVEEEVEKEEEKEAEKKEEKEEEVEEEGGGGEWGEERKPAPLEQNELPEKKNGRRLESQANQQTVTCKSGSYSHCNLWQLKYFSRGVIWFGLNV